MCKLCWGSVMVLVLVLLGGAYKVLVQGSTTPTTDGRKALLLEPSERDLVLAEMRAFLTSIQRVSQGLSEKDMKIVAEAAKQAGNAAANEVPASLMAKLPLEFKQLGFDTHSKFDQLALDASQLGDGEHTLRQMSTLLNNCLVCHQMYRIDPISTQD